MANRKDHELYTKYQSGDNFAVDASCRNCGVKCEGKPLPPGPCTWNDESEYQEENEELLFADGFEDALIGTVSTYIQNGIVEKTLYDLDLCREVLMRDGMSWDDADEYLSFNVLGAYVGPMTPAFATLTKPSEKMPCAAAPSNDIMFLVKSAIIELELTAEGLNGECETRRDVCASIATSLKKIFSIKLCGE